MKKFYFFFAMLLFQSSVLFSQVAINADGSLPNSSAMLDVKSVNKGFLPPRMTHAQLNAIVNPADGLQVYCTDCGSNGLGAMALFMSGKWYKLSINDCAVPMATTTGTHVPFENQIIWNWNASSGASGYRWGTSSNYTLSTDMSMAMTKTETGLLCNTGYTRFVWAYNTCGNSTPVTLTESTTTSTVSPPFANNHIASQNQIIWNWFPELGATGYKWNTTNSYASAIDMGTATTKTETGLLSGTMYDRYLWSYNSCGYSAPIMLSQITLEWFCGDLFTDTRDGKTYNTVSMNGIQCWFVQNLNVGTRISSSVNQTNNAIPEKYCYNNSDANCAIYGGLYQWDEMMNYTTSSNNFPSGRQGLCPGGWHVPSDVEWCQMEFNLDFTIMGCSDIGWQGTDIGGRLKETGNIHWVSPNLGATNSSGFTALPGGSSISGGSFSDLTNIGTYWSSTQGTTTNNGFGRSLDANFIQDYRSDSPKVNGQAVRCCKDF